MAPVLTQLEIHLQNMSEHLLGATHGAGVPCSRDDSQVISQIDTRWFGYQETCKSSCGYQEGGRNPFCVRKTGKLPRGRGI